MGLAGLGGGANGGMGINATNVGNPGSTPGGGGSGAAVRATPNTTMKGGDGANGKIEFTFTTRAILSKSVTDTKIYIYPNPASDKLYVNSTDLQVNKIQLLDLTGRIVYSKNVQLQNESIDISGIVSGMYIVKMYQDNRVKTTKLCVK